MDWYFGERMETNSAGEKVKKERNDAVFSACSFAHLLCVHTVFEQIFVLPLFFNFLLAPLVFHPFTEIPVQND